MPASPSPFVLVTLRLSVGLAADSFSERIHLTRTVTLSTLPHPGTVIDGNDDLTVESVHLAIHPLTPDNADTAYMVPLNLGGMKDPKAYLQEYLDDSWSFLTPTERRRATQRGW